MPKKRKVKSVEKTAKVEKRPESGSGKKTRNPALTDDQRIDFAIAKHTPKSDGRLPSFDELEEIFHVKANTISRAVNIAFARRLVEIRPVKRKLHKAVRNRSLEGDLRKRLNVTEAIVVDVHEKTQTDEIHARLGQAMARSLCDGQVIDPDERVGIGSGRAIYETAQAVSVWKLHRPGVKLLSLSGLAYGHEPVERRVLDPDRNLAALAQGFEVAPVLMTIPQPLVFDDEQEMNSTREETHLSHSKWQTLRPGVALLGLGVLAPGHRFFDAVKKDQVPPPLHAIETELRFLVDWSENVIAETAPVAYSPVGDICNRLFLVPPPPGVPKAVKDWKHAKLNVDRINRRMLSVEWEQLLEVPKVVLLAGSEIKAPAILDVLTRKPPRLKVRSLCTDSVTAEFLITLQKSAKRARTQPHSTSAQI
jgi:DNA-binding transcriptional regulator LsrR (DeoR family)